MMRIITGTARGTKLFSDEGTDTRPTSERTKEAVFSMIQFDIEGRKVLDLFGGSGQLGLEALSRGAVTAVFCDASKKAVEIIGKNAEKTKLSEKCRIINDDYRRALSLLRGEKFDIVFLDPPYKSKLVPSALSLLLENELLKASSLIVCETNGESDSVFGDTRLRDTFRILKENKYGVAYITLLTQG